RAAEPRAGRDALVEVHGGRKLLARGALERGVSFVHRVVFAVGKVKPGDRESCLAARGSEGQQVVELDRLHRRLDVAESVGAPTDDVEIKIQLGARRQREDQSPAGFSSARYLTTRRR